MEGGRGSQRSSLVSSGQRPSAVNVSQQRSSDNLEDEDDYDSSDDDEMCEYVRKLIQSWDPYYGIDKTFLGNKQVHQTCR